MEQKETAVDIICEKKTGWTILNLGAGKINPDFMNRIAEKSFVVNVDQSYTSERSTASDIVSAEYDHEKREHEDQLRDVHNISADIFEFLGTYKHKFETIIMSRIAEHMFYDAGEVGQLLSMSRNLLAKGGQMFIIVPNHARLAKKLLNYDPDGIATEVNHDLLLLNTEFCNTRCDPHGSIWTTLTAKSYIENEGNLKITAYHQDVKWDGREYMLIVVKKRGDD